MLIHIHTCMYLLKCKKKKKKNPFFQFAVKSEMELLVAYTTEPHMQVFIIINDYIASNLSISVFPCIQYEKNSLEARD